MRGNRVRLLVTKMIQQRDDDPAAFRDNLEILVNEISDIMMVDDIGTQIELEAVIDDIVTEAPNAVRALEQLYLLVDGDEL